jgi:hypothetical protein
MRITLSLDQDILEKARSIAAETHVPLSVVVNQALRFGLGQMENAAKQRPYRTVTYAMQLRAGFDADNIQELLARVEGEDFR